MRWAEEATRQAVRRAGKAIDKQMLPEKNAGDATTQTDLAEQASYQDKNKKVK